MDRDEIYSILRLVKLNADFPNSIYLLSFDEEMVAEAIGERFGEKGKEAGRNFLEKIIQVPLYLPKLLKSDLLSYSFNEISKVINSLGLGISNDDLESFPTYFRECISSRITTPRLVIRYINSISFSLPLLKGEINIADLLLIESVKVFYPNHYQYIKDNTSYFLKQYKAASPFSLESEGIDEATKLIRNALEDLAIDLSHEDKKDIITLLNYIFPQTKSIYANIDNSAMYSDWLKKKRICTSQYYERYFIYAVLKGDLSDIKFDDYLKNISSINLELCGHELYRLIEDSSEEAVLTRLSANQKEFSDEIRNKICLAICSFGNKLTSTHNLSIFLSPQRQYARLVVEIVLNTQTPLEKLKKIFKETHIIFLQHIWDVLVARNDKESFLEKKEIKYLAKEMVKNAQDQAKSTPMFEIDYINTYLIFNLWYEWDNKEFTKYIYNYLEKEPKKVLGILKDSASQILKFGEKDFIRCSITKDNFEFMKKIYDLDYLYKCIEKSFPKQLTQEVIWSRENEEIKDELIYIGQFLHYYKEDKRNEEY